MEFLPASGPHSLLRNFSYTKVSVVSRPPPKNFLVQSGKSTHSVCRTGHVVEKGEAWAELRKPRIEIWRFIPAMEQFLSPQVLNNMENHDSQIA